MERVKGIEPSYAAWEAAVLPLNYTRTLLTLSGEEFTSDAFHWSGCEAGAAWGIAGAERA